MGLRSEYGDLLARAAYEAYCEAVGWKSVITDQELPVYEELPDIIKVGWASAAYAVKTVLDGTSIY